MEDPASSIPPSSIWGSLNSSFTSTGFFILLNLMIATILFTSNLPNNNNNNNNHQHQEQQEDQQQQKQNSHNQPQIARSPSILHRLKSFNFLPQIPQIEDDTQHHEQEPLHVAATQYIFNQPLHYQHFDFDSTVSDQTHLVETVNTHFEFDPTRQENDRDLGFDFHSNRKENDKDASFDFEPTREEILGNTGLDFDPTHEDEHADEFESLDEVYSKLKGGGHHDRTKSDGEIRQKPTKKFKKSGSLKVGFTYLDEEKTVEARRPATVREGKMAVKAAADDDVEINSKADDFINKFKNDLKLQRIESIMKSKGGKN